MKYIIQDQNNCWELFGAPTSSKMLSGAAKSTRPIIDIQSIPRMNKLFAILTKIMGLKKLSKNIRKTKP
jgi:hypothetical protein